MARRFLIGLFKGLALGVVLAAAVIWGLGIPVWPAVIAYLAAAVAGALTGLVAGRPIWATEAKLEASLKALVGAFVAVVAAYGARKWFAGVNFDLSAWGAGRGALGELPAVLIPIVTGALGILFELDNTEEPERPKGPRHRVEARAEPSQPEEAEFAEKAAPVRESRRRS